MSTAYLVGFFSMHPPLPKLVDAMVCGEENPSTTSFTERYPVALVHADGPTYEAAERNLLRLCREHPEWRWAVPVLEKAVRR